MTRKTERDQAIVEASRAGQPMEDLAREFSVTIGRIKAILVREAHMREVSQEPFYKMLRTGLWHTRHAVGPASS